ncbi:MAG TPA: hypothetical protein VNT99_05455 [Methylomirabilota bacterium]|nr:hypothetical protein [Methylomirabilota bacterium]
MMRIPSLIALGWFLVCGCAGPFELRKTKWSVPEVQEWYADYRTQKGAWDGILYRGSDSKYHHFVARVIWVDNWAIIQIKKEELALADERPYSTASSGDFGYYCVDPSRGFIKVQDQGMK